MAVLRLFLLFLMAPVLVAQAVRVRRATPRLPGATGPIEGALGTGRPLRLTVIGESTVDGVGAATHADALTGQLAVGLVSAYPDREVRWHALGITGASARVVLDELVPRVRAADIVVVVLGVNDTLELHSAARYRRDLLHRRGAAEDRRRPGRSRGRAAAGEFPVLAPAAPGRAGRAVRRARPGGAHLDPASRGHAYPVGAGIAPSGNVRRRPFPSRPGRLPRLGRRALGGITDRH